LDDHLPWLLLDYGPNLDERMTVSRSYVVTGAGGGIGRALVDRLLGEAADNTVVAIELDPAALSWLDGHPAGSRAIAMDGDASDEAVAGEAADLAQEAGSLSGWVNNAAVFRDAALHSGGAREVLDAIALNLDLAVVGCSTAIGRFLPAGTGGAIINVSSHQAQRAVRGALPYATAKAAIEGLTRALAVDYGPYGIRTNAVALGSITTERHEEFLARQEPAVVRRIEEERRLLHPLGRMGRPEEAAATISYLISEEASFINGAIVPVDGGRSALGRDPEEA
jgi:NAD(P)-dependent dehydrogenase (short-subunit alcohol dehydrogenase family)